MTDHRALIEDAKKKHRTESTVFTLSGRKFQRCTGCSEDAPCLTARLAEALERADQSIAELEIESDEAEEGWGGASDDLRQVCIRLAAAEREVADNRAMFERQAAAVRHHTARAAAAERQMDAARSMDVALQRWVAACDAFDDAASGSWSQHEAWMEACEAELAVKTLARAALAPTKEDPA